MGVTIPSAAGEVLEQYEVSNSLRFNSADSAYLHITPSASNRDLFTISLWAKRSSLNTGARQVLFGVGNPATSSQVGFEIRFDDSVGDGKLRITDYVAASSDNLVLKTNALFRDPSAWYHIVFAYDSAQGTDSNRAKVYVNGTQITSFATATYPSQNQDSAVGSNTKHLIGNLDGDGYDYNGYLTEVNYVDGAAKSPTDFGKFDDNGVWIPKRYTGTYGTNGFFLQFKQTGTSANSSGIGADTSGNDNHFAVTNLAATDVTEDTCTNNFCTMSPIDTNRQASLSEGNTQLQRGSNYAGCNGTFGVSSGKWYWEVKTPSPTGNGENSGFGVTKIPHATIGNNYLGYQNATEWAIFIDNADSDIFKIYNNSTTDYNVNASSNDIFQIALDMDNNKIYFGRNGTYFASGNPAGNSNEAYSSVSGDPFLFPAFSMNGNDTLQVNFGNPSFAISSGNTDGKYGNFEYAPPSGYYALCTKRLAEFG